MKRSSDAATKIFKCTKSLIQKHFFHFFSKKNRKCVFFFHFGSKEVFNFFSSSSRKEGLFETCFKFRGSRSERFIPQLTFFKDPTNFFFLRFSSSFFAKMSNFLFLPLDIDTWNVLSVKETVIIWRFNVFNGPKALFTRGQCIGKNKSLRFPPFYGARCDQTFWQNLASFGNILKALRIIFFFTKVA